MTVAGVSSLDAIALNEDKSKTYSKMELLAEKVQAIWSKVYDVTIGNVVRVVYVIRNAIGAVVRDLFFFPLKCSLIANLQMVKKQLNIEETYCQDFWDPSKSLDPNLKNHQDIRELFNPPKDVVIPIHLKEGSKVEITCRVIETKESGDHYYNFVSLPGIFATVSNNIGATHPYLSAYVDAKKGAATLSPARFIIISENNLNIKPKTLEEAGFILLETLKSMRTMFGDIDQLVAHSLGNIFLANALKQVEDPQCLPKNLCMDRGPSGIWEASKKYAYGLGSLLYVFAKLGGWSIDLAEEVAAFCKKWKERPSLLVCGMVQDHHFSESANLCLANSIQGIKDVEVLVFDPPRQVIHEHGHHNLRSDLINSCYLVKKSNYMNPLETLPEAVLRHSLPGFETCKQSA